MIPWDISGLGAGALGLKMAALVDDILTALEVGFNRIQRDSSESNVVIYILLYGNVVQVLE